MTLTPPKFTEDTKPIFDHLSAVAARFEERVTFQENPKMASQCWLWGGPPRMNIRKLPVVRSRAQKWTKGSLQGVAYDQAYPGNRTANAQTIRAICGNDTCINPDHLTCDSWWHITEAEHLLRQGLNTYRIAEKLGLTIDELYYRVRWYSDTRPELSWMTQALLDSDPLSIIDHKAKDEDLLVAA